MKIAVVGSGIAGLAASWFLGARHEVHLFEKQPELGMAARGLEWGGARVDMPLRVLYRGYYPTLTALYADAGIAITSSDYSASFSDLDGTCYFRYRNWRPWQRVSLPFLGGGQPLGQRTRHIVTDLARLYARARRDREGRAGEGVSLQQYLDAGRYSEAFTEDFLLPTFAAIGTCDVDSVRRYPATVVLDYLSRGVLLEGVSRTVHGADHVVQRLSQRCSALHLGAGVQGIERHSDGVQITDGKGVRHGFDHLVLATQGNQALRLLGAAAEDAEAEALSAFRYEASAVVVHTDPRLMPSDRKNWSPVNFFRDRSLPRPMASIWLNRVLPIAEDAPDAFQTWNPLLDADEAKVHARAHFERPVVDAASQTGLKGLQALHRAPHRRIWFCGSYAESGVPLLESAARSAKQVAERIG
ncbi:FAD-dependent oxidoreductase [Algiphilus sp.]|uniref:FAD-dependent oxidoreductase n=1 Tax=Algiphilus sp. TaxID=1872431 RepID=UPI003BA92530